MLYNVPYIRFPLVADCYVLSLGLLFDMFDIVCDGIT